MPTVIEEKPSVADPDFKRFMEAATKPVEDNMTPDNYAVILHNDHTTPFYLVVNVLREAFGLPSNRAQDIMMQAHESGQAVVAKMTEKEADDKIAQAAKMSTGYELRFSKEKE